MRQDRLEEVLPYCRVNRKTDSCRGGEGREETIKADSASALLLFKL